MLALAHAVSTIFGWVPGPPGWRARGPVDPRIDPDALAAFALAELAHPELPLRFAFERAVDARDERRGWTAEPPGAPLPLRRDVQSATVADDDLPAIVELPEGWPECAAAEAEWQPAPRTTRVTHVKHAFGPHAPAPADVSIAPERDRQES